VIAMLSDPHEHTRTFLWWIYLGHWLMAWTDEQWRFNPVTVYLYECVCVCVCVCVCDHAFISHAAAYNV